MARGFLVRPLTGLLGAAVVVAAAGCSDPFEDLYGPPPEWSVVGTAILIDSSVSGFNRVYRFDLKGYEFAIALAATELCPLTFPPGATERSP